MFKFNMKIIRYAHSSIASKQFSGHHSIWPDKKYTNKQIKKNQWSMNRLEKNNKKTKLHRKQNNKNTASSESGSQKQMNNQFTRTRH